MFFVAAGTAADVPLNPNHPTRYVVRPGDTLWDVAGRFLQEPWRWGEIWRANPGIGDPDLIYPGDVLVLTYENGGPQVSREGEGLRVVKLTPRVRVEVLDQAIPTIPANVIAPFLTQAYVLDKAEMDAAPYVVGFPEEHIVAGLADSIYVRAITAGDSENYDIIRPGPAYIDPDTGEVLGYEAAYIANAGLARPGDPARLRIERSKVEVAVGDRLIPTHSLEPLRSLEPRSAPVGVRGRIIGVLNGVTQIGRYNVVVLNRGSADGVDPGHVFAVYQGGEERSDDVKAGLTDWRNWQDETPLSAQFWYDRHRVVGWREGRPDENHPLPLHVEVRKPIASYVVPYERSGVLLVFRSFPRVSFALVMEALRPMRVLDSVGAPET